MTRTLFLLVMIVLGCTSRERAPAAVLAQAAGPVERAASGGSFEPIAVGAKLYLGDFVRTHDTAAHLALHGGGTVVMEPHTTIVLRSRSGRLQLEVGAGGALLDGPGPYAFEMGQLQLVDGKVRIATTAGRSSLELVLGQGVLIDERGEQRALVLGEVVLLEMGQLRLVPPDAAVPAVHDAAPVGKAAEARTSDETIAIEVTGDGVKMQRTGTKEWLKLEAGDRRIAEETRLMVDAKSSLKLTTTEAVFTVAGGSRLSLAKRFVVTMERGTLVASAAPGHDTEIHVPGGAVMPMATTTGGADVRVDVDARRDAHVSALGGRAKLTSKRAGAPPLDLEAGGTAILHGTGNLALGTTVIPQYFDYELAVGKWPSVTIHDPEGATALRFQFAGRCPGTAVIELDRHHAFRTPHITSGKEAAHLLVRSGSWAYRLRCGGVGAAIATGRVTVIRDRGTRPLPKDPPRYPIDADGRTYRVDYQSRIPDIEIRAKNASAPAELYLSSEGTTQVRKSETGTFAISGATLQEREYTFYVVQNGKESKRTTLRIGFDQTAAQVYIEAPVDGLAWGSEVDVRGATLLGWSAQIAGVDVASDQTTRRFHTRIAPPPHARAIAIELSHPQRGVHIYLRRGRPATPP